MSILSVKTFPRIPTFYYPVILTLEFDLLFHNFNLAYNIWAMSATVTALTLHMGISSDNTSPLVPTYFILWPRPWRLTPIYWNKLWPWPCRLVHFLKALTLWMIVKQWVQVFLVEKPFRGYMYQHFYPMIFESDILF